MVESRLGGYRKAEVAVINSKSSLLKVKLIFVIPILLNFAEFIL